MNLGLDMSLKLQQKLSFQMIQSLKLLQVNTLQLEQVLKTELEMNPVLEAGDEMEQETDESRDHDEKEENEKESESDELEVNEDSIDWEEYLEEGFDLGYSYNEEIDPNEERYEPTPVYQDTLEEHLTKQLTERKLDERKQLICEFLIGSLDTDGYLRLPVDELAAFIQADPFEVMEALQIMWSMDPPGVAARDLRECMLLQLRARRKEGTLAMRIIEETWDLFEKLKIPEISRHFNVEPKQIQDALETLKTINPKPGYQYNPDKPSTIIPDLIVEKIDGKFVVMLNDRSVPSLHINKSYANMIKRGSSAKKDVKKYVREKFNSATWFIRSIEQRKTTMLKVMYAIIERQEVFFEKGPPNLNPLKLQDVADMVEMHISTVSRVTSNKFVQTRHGIFELKYFFTEAVGRDAEGADISSERIKNRIKQLVEMENTKKPLSDQKISDILSQENLAVARRTVAKYREQMKILPARLRQKYE
ncbi:MAG TPA: RNA polymerase factor sigma-54 [Chitinispirillaceae bacterium]|nr:RNA polymerase factor sigma-54 [Chitinispirillaceae bacterium]